MRTIPIRHVAPALASILLVFSATAAGHAQDGRSFFEQLFGAPPPPAAIRSEVFDPYAARASRGYGEARRSRPRTRYAALPRAEDDKLSGKQPVDQKAIQDNPTKAILEDKTLRPGDIVVLPGGPRVFTGGSEKRHRLSDFEDVKHSGFVDRKTRQQLLAMMVPVGAMPADQARKVLARKHRLAHPDEIAQVEAQQAEAQHDATIGSARDVARNEAGARVINPWNAVR